MGEHSVMDGTPSLVLCDRVLTALRDNHFDHGDGLISSTSSGLTLLDFAVSADTRNAIQAARTAASELISSQTLGMLTIPYGQEEIKRHGVSPDIWAQMVIQLAYHRLTSGKRDGGTYQAASTRGFFKGRTETVRVVTDEVVRWCEAMDRHEGANRNKLLFGAASKRLGNDAREASRAMGVDRHLLGE